jgi:hypothetical protein
VHLFFDRGARDCLFLLAGAGQAARCLGVASCSISLPEAIVLLFGVGPERLWLLQEAGLVHQGDEGWRLTAEGERTLAASAVVVPERLQGDSPQPAGANGPCWNRNTRRLEPGGGPARQILPFAHRQIALLDAFQHADWPAVLNNPFPGNRRKAAQTLRDAVRGLKAVLGRAMTFEVCDRGRRVRWRIGSTTNATP